MGEVVYEVEKEEIYRADHEAEHRKNIAETSVGSEESARTTPPTPHVRRGR